MRRICLCLLIALALAFASAGVAAREVKLSSPHSGSCPETTSPKPSKQKVAPPRETSPSRETRARPSLHSDSDVGSGKPRWHSFLPGMFR